MRRQIFFVAIIFSVFSLLLFWPVFLGKVNLNGHLLVSFYSFFGENLPYKSTGWDQLRIYFPFYKVTFDAFRNLAVPLWNPYAFAGHPHMADFQSAVFYPLNIFGLFLSQIAFWHFLRITPQILAASFMFLYLHSGLRLSRLASFFGALTFGFSPFILTWGEEVVQSVHSIVWMPLVLWGIEKIINSKKSNKLLLEIQANKYYLAAIAISVAFSIFGGYMQTTIYMFIFVAFYLAFRLWETSVISKGLMVIGAMAWGILISAIQILPSAELFFNAARSQITLRESLFGFLIPIESVLTYIAPDFFGSPATGNFFRGGSAQYYEGILFVGILAMVFGAYVIFSHFGKWRKLIVFLSLFAIISTSTTFNLPTSKLFLSLPIPFLSTSIANRILFLGAFCIATLASLGIEAWLSTKDRKILKTLGAFFGIYVFLFLVLLLVKVFHLPYFEKVNFAKEGNLMVSLRNLVVPFAVFLAGAVLIVLGTFKPKMKTASIVLVTLLCALHIFYFANKYFSFVDKKYVFPNVDVLDFVFKNQGIWRSWGVGKAYMETNFQTQYGLYSASGYDSLNNRSYGEFTYGMRGGKIDDFIFRSDAGLGDGTFGDWTSDNLQRRLVDLVGVKYVIAQKSDEQQLAAGNLKKVFEGGRQLVFENVQAVPRVFLASDYEGPPDVFGEEPKTNEERIEREKQRRKLIFNKLLNPEFDLASKIILEKPSTISPQHGPGTVDILEYKPQSVIVKTKSQVPKILFLSDNWYPGWKATVDGDLTEIWRADYTFRAVPLTPGEHIVKFYYDPSSFKVGFLISVFAIFGILGLIFYPLSKSYKGKI